jgi:hypothetical protein
MKEFCIARVFNAEEPIVDKETHAETMKRTCFETDVPTTPTDTPETQIDDTEVTPNDDTPDTQIDSV